MASASGTRYCVPSQEAVRLVSEADYPRAWLLAGKF